MTNPTSLDWCDKCQDMTTQELTLLSAEPLHEALERYGIPLYGEPSTRLRTWERACLGCRQRRERSTPSRPP